MPKPSSSKLRTLDLDEPVRKKKKKVEVEEPVRKKKRLVEEPEEPVRKKKKKTSALALTIKKLDPDRISRLDADGQNSIMGEHAEAIQKMLEAGQNEGAMTQIQKRLLQALVDLIPHAENNVRATKGQKGVYQINSLITSVRELLSDIQATRDRGAIGVNLVEKIMRPAFMDIGMILVQEEARFATAIRDLVEPETFKKLRTEHKECIGRVAHVMNAKYDEVKNGTITFLQT